MKITSMPVAGNTTPQTQTKTTKTPVSTTTTAVSPSAEEITQSGLQTAQESLNSDNSSDVDYDKVAQMKAALASGELTVNNDDLASSMLSFFQK